MDKRNSGLSPRKFYPTSILDTEYPIIVLVSYYYNSASTEYKYLYSYVCRVAPSKWINSIGYVNEVEVVCYFDKIKSMKKIVNFMLHNIGHLANNKHLSMSFYRYLFLNHKCPNNIKIYAWNYCTRIISTFNNWYPSRVKCWASLWRHVNIIITSAIAKMLIFGSNNLKPQTTIVKMIA